MTQALIQSADVDGFRVDTPMQAPFDRGLEELSHRFGLGVMCVSTEFTGLWFGVSTGFYRGCTGSGRQHRH